ncbi:MAG: NUDIX hydrolase [Gemmobacter sp.]
MNATPIRTRDIDRNDSHTQHAALCWRRQCGGVEVLLITSRDTRRWVIPKGWPMEGRTGYEAAAVEAWEEAGVEGRVTPVCIGNYSYLKDRSTDLPCTVEVYPVEVRALAREFPERAERRRRWMSPVKAAGMVEEPELRALIAGFDPAAVRA